MSDYGAEIVTIVEIDVPFCDLVYGESPCSAVLGETGARKCFNTAATCQDRENFSPATLTLRFGMAQSGIQQYGPITPNLRGVDISPLEINIGGMDDSTSPFGRRETCNLLFDDHQHSDVQRDKYRLERYSGDAQDSGEGYDPYERGTHWGKFIARHPFHEGYAVRVYQGEMGQDIADMRVRRYLIDKINGPDDGQVRVACKDLFSLVESRKAKAPRASRGELASDISESASEANLSPPGIGDEEYPSSGWVAINDEAIAFTRSGDTLTLTERGALGTTAEEHENEDKVQIVLAYEAQEVPDIVEDLLVNFANVPSANIPKSDWDAEADDNIQALYTAYIAEPVAVEDLVGELAVQAGFSIWPDVETNLIRLRAIVPPVLQDPGPIVTDNDWIREGSFSIQRQPQKRVSQVWVYYGQRNPLEDVDEPTNYASRVIRADLDAQLDEEYGTPSVREVFGRWIPQFGRGVAETAGDRILSIFRDPPLRGKFNTDVSRDGELQLAEPFRLRTDDVQDDTGERRQTNHVPIQLFRDNKNVSVKFQELDFFTLPDEGFNLFIDADTNNFNVRSEFETLFGQPSEGDVVNVFIAQGVVVGSSSKSEPAMIVGDWPDDVEIKISLAQGALIAGRGGVGGKGGSVDSTSGPHLGGGGGGGASLQEGGPPGENLPGTSSVQEPPLPGEQGGPAFSTEYPVTIDNSGTIAGGGGGGGGGGAAWFGPSNSPSPEPGDSAFLMTGGEGGAGDAEAGDGGKGGDIGQDGSRGEDAWDLSQEAAEGADGGSVGPAIDGESFITYDNEGTILGDRIN